MPSDSPIVLSLVRHQELYPGVTAPNQGLGALFRGIERRCPGVQFLTPNYVRDVQYSRGVTNRPPSIFRRIICRFPGVQFSSPIRTCVDQIPVGDVNRPPIVPLSSPYVQAAEIHPDPGLFH